MNGDLNEMTSRLVEEYKRRVLKVNTDKRNVIMLRGKEGSVW